MHIKYNQLLCELKGYDLEKLESIFVKSLEKSHTDKVDNKTRLAITTAIEHITATMGTNILKGKILKSDNPVVDMWKWHSLDINNLDGFSDDGGIIDNETFRAMLSVVCK